MSSYTTQIASDVPRDGLGVELLDSEGEVVAEIFRSDRDLTVIESLLREDLPDEAIEMMRARARATFESFYDGTPLSSASRNDLRPSS